VHGCTVEGEETAVKKKVVYGKKKPQPKPKPAETDAQLASASSGAAAAAETQAAAEASIAAAQAQAEEAKAQAQQAEEAQKQQEAEVHASDLVFLAHQISFGLPCTFSETLAATQCDATELLRSRQLCLCVLYWVFVSLCPCAGGTVDGKACLASPDHNVSCIHLC